MMMDQLRQLSASNQRANEVEDVSNMYDKMLINKQHAGPGAMAHMSQLQQQHNLSVSSLSATPSPSSLSSSSSLNVGMDNNHHGGMMRNQQHAGMNTLGNGPDSMDETESLCDDYPTPSSNFLKVTKTTLDQWSLSIINNSSFFFIAGLGFGQDTDQSGTVHYLIVIIGSVLCLIFPLKYAAVSTATSAAACHDDQ